MTDLITPATRAIHGIASIPATGIVRSETAWHG